MSEVKKGFLTAEYSRRILNVSDVTLRKWASEGKIEFTRASTSRSHRRYNVHKFLFPVINEEKSPQPIRRKIIYTRVSTRGQIDNLERQIKFLQDQYPNHQLIRDIGSGINFKRKGLKTILDYAIRNELEEVVVAYKDRLCRFGFDLLEHLFKQASNARIVVLDNRETSPDQELAEDVLSIVTVFSARINGRKKYGKKHRKPPDPTEEKFNGNGGKGNIENHSYTNISFLDSEGEVEGNL